MKKGAESIRYKAILEIITKYDTMSPTDITKHLKEDYGIETTRQTITKDLKKDLEVLTEDKLKNMKSKMFAEIDELIQIAYTQSKSGDALALKAMNAYNKLFKTKAEVIKKFEETKIKMNQGQRPIYNVSIGKPIKVDVKKYGRRTTESNGESTTVSSD